MVEGAIRRLYLWTIEVLSWFHNGIGAPVLRPTSKCMKYSDTPRQDLVSLRSYFVIIEITMPHPGPLCKAGPRNLWEGSGVVWNVLLFNAIPTSWVLWFLRQALSSPKSLDRQELCVPGTCVTHLGQETTWLLCGIQFNYHSLSTGLYKELNENTFHSLHPWIPRSSGGENLAVGTGSEEGEGGTE